MALFGIFGGETRSTFENPSVSLTDTAGIRALFGGNSSFSEEIVNEETALGIPAIWAAVDFLSASVAKLPLHVYRDSPDGPIKADGDPVYGLLRSVVNDDGLTVYQWLRQMMLRLTLEGRALYWIERNRAGRVSNIWPVDVRKTRITATTGRRVYHVDQDDGRPPRTFSASEVLDFVYMPQRDGVKHRNPLETNRNIIGEMIAAQRFASQNFAQGGVPAAVATMPQGSPQAMDRAAAEIAARLKASGKGPLMALPNGVEIKPIGLNHAEIQMLELRKFHVLEAGRIWNLPSAFLKDLTTGSFSNTEQQDLQLVKHSLTQWLCLIEQELNSKLFGRKSSNYVKFNISALLRGDLQAQGNFLKSLSDAGIYTKNEARAYLDMPAIDGGDVLLVQQQMIPMAMAGQHVSNTNTTTQNQDPEQPGEEVQ